MRYKRNKYDWTHFFLFFFLFPSDLKQSICSICMHRREMTERTYSIFDQKNCFSFIFFFHAKDLLVVIIINMLIK